MTNITTSLEHRVKSPFSVIGGNHIILMADPESYKMLLYTAITQEGTVSLETRLDTIVMGTAGFEPTTSTN
jgi:hypothetical protein